MHAILTFFNPLAPRGARWRHYVILAVALLLIVGASFYAGWRAGQPAAQYHQQFAAYKVNVPLPPRPSGPTAALYQAPRAASGHVKWQYLADVQNQGSVGSCQCWAFGLQFDYLTNAAHNWTGAARRQYSCRFWYNVATQGQDTGSYPDQYPPILATQGGVTREQFDWPGSPSGTEWPLPSSLYSLARAHLYTLKTEVISAGQGGGQNAVNGAETALSKHLPVNIDLPVYSGAGSFYDPSGLIDTTHSGQEVGGHAVTLVAYYRNLTINGVTGWFLLQNQWTTGWGLNRTTLQPDHQNGGYALISYRMVASEAFGLEVFHLSSNKPQAVRAPAWFQPSPAIHHPLPAPHLAPHLGAPRAAGSYVYGVYARDLYNTDLGSTINAAARANDISAPGLLSVLGAECGLYTTSPHCDRWGYWPDVSFGSCQVTVQTAGGFGVGSGSYADAYGVRNYEDQAGNCIWLAALVLGSYKRYLASLPGGCWVDFPNLYVAWNAGPGNPCWFILHPSGQAGSNYYGNYLGWWQWALQYSRTSDPYYHPVFNLALWNSARDAHHKARISPYWGKSYSWAASVFTRHPCLGGVRDRGRWYGSYTKTRFAHGAVFTWPRYHAAKATC